MRHSAATIPDGQAPRNKSARGRPASDQMVFDYLKIDVINAAHDVVDALENAAAKKHESILADIAARNAVIAHMKRIRAFNSSAAA